MKIKFKFSKSSVYLKMFLALTLVITIITSSLPIVYSATDTTNTVNALSNPDFESGSDSWINSSGVITVESGAGITPADSTTPSAALKLASKDNAVYQSVTKSDGSDFVQGSTFNWKFNFKSTTKDDVVALVLGTSEPTGNPDQFRQMISWLKTNKKVTKNIPDNGQYQVIVYSKPFKDGGAFDNGKFGNLRANFSLTPTMYCTEKWTVILARTNPGDWKTISNPATTPFTLVKNSPSITYSLLSYSGDILVDDVSFLIEKPGEEVKVYNNLQNGSFEKKTFAELEATTFYKQTPYKNVAPWQTTSTDTLIELFIAKGNTSTTSHFPPQKNVNVVEGTQAAELNAEQSSTLYQYIKTESDSQYKWKLSHRGRFGADIMALVIGPKQEVDPCKINNDKFKYDQFMQMVDWVKENKEYYPDVQDQIAEIEQAQKSNERKTTDYRCKPVKVTVYSKPFAAKGGFVSDNATYFSATESTVFSEEWDVTILCSGNLDWQTYGENDDDMYSYYNVPEGQTDSIFAFTAYKGTNHNDDSSYVTDSQKAKMNTYGNLLDDVNFDLYYPASSVSFTGGDAVLNYVYKDNLLTSELKSGEPAKSIMVDENSTFTLDVKPSISTKTVLDENGNAVVDENGNVKTEPRLDANNKPIQNTFLGAYITIGGQRKYYPATAINSTDNAIYFSETTEIIDGKEMTVYHYGQSNVSGRVVVELVYSEVYTMIYNSKGGKEYSVRYSEKACDPDTSHMDWKGSNANIARFYEKATCTYTSTACQWWEDNPNVVFKGWELVGGKITKLSDDTTVPDDEKVLFRGNATVTYNAPTRDDIDTTGKTETEIESAILEEARKRDFIISDGIYEGRVNAYGGGVLVANWEYKTSVIAQTEQLDGSFINSGIGGQVALTGHTMDVTDDKGTIYSGDSNIDFTDKFTFTSAFNNVVKASQQEKAGYKFLGWYDKSGNKLSATSDHSFTIEPYYSTSNKDTDHQTPGVVYARFGFEYKVKFHINDSATVSTVGNPDADLYRVYYPEGVDISQASNLNLDYEILHLDSNNKIQYFYDIPVPKSTNGKIFKGWYEDKDNNTDSNAIQWNNKAYTTETDIYAHWIDVGTVNQDAEDKNTVDSVNNPSDSVSKTVFGGFDLLGVQIRYEQQDENYPNGTGSTPHFTEDGLRFITCIKEDVLSQSSTLFKKTYTGFTTKQPLRYGYVVAKESTASSKLANGKKLEYCDSNVNGVDTGKDYGFVMNVDCTSGVGGYKDTPILDHKNFENYRVYSMIVSYDTSGKSDAEIESAKQQNVVARPYLRYQDANGLYRTYYQDYTGTALYGGCSVSYNSAWNYLNDKGFFPKDLNQDPII